MSGPRVVIVDDHGLFRAGVKAELEELVELAGDAGTVDDGRRRDRAHASPTWCCSTCTCPTAGGVEVIRRVAADHPAVRFLALSASDAAEDVIAVIRAGARGYVTKTISSEELADAVRRVHDGDAVFSPRLAGFVLDSFAGAPPPGRARPGRRARPAHPARARGAPAHRARLHVQGDRPRPRASPPRPSRPTCRRCCASSSCRAATSSAAGRPGGAWTRRLTAHEEQDQRNDCEREQHRVDDRPSGDRDHEQDDSDCEQQGIPFLGVGVGTPAGSPTPSGSAAPRGTAPRHPTARRCRARPALSTTPSPVTIAPERPSITHFSGSTSATASSTGGSESLE